MDDILYGAGWLKHPSCIWVMDYMWLYNHIIICGYTNNIYYKDDLLKNLEYTKRYGKQHLTITKLGDLLKKQRFKE